jgi:Patatin-like phospholipase
MPTNGGELKSDGSYLWELAVRAIARETPNDLVVDRKVYEARREEAKQENNPKLMADYLANIPQLQEQLAFFLDYVPSKWLLSQEIPAVVERRKIHHIAASYNPDDNPYDWARGQKLQGICLSGGGIRSATFNLGVLQGLAKLGILHKFDYLSSVSGGGYIHEWLASWIKREEGKTERDECDKDPPGGGVPAARAGLRRVQNRLQPLPAGKQLPFQPEPLRWLRRYSNYLTPQKGIFTADTWVAVAIWLRNTFLNQLILVSGLFFLVLVPHLVSPGLQAIPRWLAWAGAFLLFAIATGVMWAALHREYERVRHLDMYGEQPAQKEPRKFGGERAVQLAIVLPLLSASVLFLIAMLSCLDGVAPLAVFLLLTMMIAGIGFAGGVVRSYEINHGLISGPDKKTVPATETTVQQRVVRLWNHGRSFALGCGQLFLRVAGQQKGPLSNDERNAYRNLRVFFSAVLSSAVINGVIAAAAGVALAIAIGSLLGIPGLRLGNSTPWHVPGWIHSTPESLAKWRIQLTIGPPLFLFVPFFSMVLAAGLVGRNYPDWLREWLARVRAWSLLFGIGWLVYVGISLLGPSIFEWFSTTEYKKLAASIKWTAVLAWLATTVGSVMSGNSKKVTGTPQDSSVALNLVAKIGPYVFILGLLVILSGIADWGFHSAYGDYTAGHYTAITLLMLLPLAIFAVFGWRVDINEFSMNTFYRNRLTRCYLGATNTQRDPNPLTGFDDRDTRDMQISRLKPNPENPNKGYSGPLPIICTTINLSFGEDLAYQERKAASFAFSPLYSGYTVGWTAGKAGKRLSFNGFVPTGEYFDPHGGINISTAVAISGAAASPNWGYHTNPATAFLMTMFNVRLGWWMFNPRRSSLAGCLPGSPIDEPEWPSPRFAPLELANELLGRSDDKSKYVYLSDGGHFDNMGLYELVRRRCYKIVICDAEEDEKYVFEGLGMSIRKCRIDFGVEIKLKMVGDLRPDLTTGDCKAHFALGTIRYPETPASEEEEGQILYIKSSVTGSVKWPTNAGKNFILLDPEPLDILNYKLQHDSFPHDSTANQWFTESQFESYRRLGQHVVEEIATCDKWKDFK